MAFQKKKKKKVLKFQKIYKEAKIKIRIIESLLKFILENVIIFEKNSNKYMFFKLQYINILKLTKSTFSAPKGVGEGRRAFGNAF